MIYITKDDLTDVIQEPLLNSVITNSIEQYDEEKLTRLEITAIERVKSYIDGRYDLSKVFTTPYTRNELLVECIAQLIIHKAIGRNAARKLGENHKDMLAEAKSTLKKIQSGEIKLLNIPEKTGADGTTSSLMYGNNTNVNNFI